MSSQKNASVLEIKAQRELDLFLEQHPELRKMQEEINARLIAAGSVENRLNVLSIMIEGKLKELHDQLSALTSSMYESITT